MVVSRRFKGVVRNVTLSKEDMNTLLNMPLEEIDLWSPIKVEVLQNWDEVAQTLASSMVKKIKENNRAGRLTSFILPVGPTDQYPKAAEISNKERVSWKNVWTFNMDEYLDWQGRPIPNDHPMSFHSSMNRNLFDRLEKELTVPEKQRWFPDPFNPDAIDDKIEEITESEGVDVCYGGIGEHGHIAFNEAASLMTHFIHLTPEEFKSSKSRVLPHLNPETLTRALERPQYTLSPPGAVTLGMKSILSARTIELAGAGPEMRIAAMHPPTMDFPVTFIQEHPDPRNTVILYTSTEQKR